MATKDDTERSEQPTKTPLATPSCSPFEIPETEKAWRDCLNWCEKRNESHDPHHAALANLSEKLEKERDEARGIAATMRDKATGRTKGDPKVWEDDEIFPWENSR